MNSIIDIVEHHFQKAFEFKSSAVASLEPHVHPIDVSRFRVRTDERYSEIEKLQRNFNAMAPDVKKVVAGTTLTYLEKLRRLVECNVNADIKSLNAKKDHLGLDSIVPDNYYD